MTGVMVAFWVGIIVCAVFPDRSERAAFKRWRALRRFDRWQKRQRAATIPRARDVGRHYGQPHPGRQ